MKNKWVKVLEGLFLVLSVLSVMYFLCLAAYIGLGSKFNYFWLLLGIIFFSAFLVPKLIRLKSPDFALPTGVKLGAVVIVIAILVVFAAVEGSIVKNALTTPKENAEYVLVLGAKVNGTVPSRSLMYRINSAYDYLVENESAKVIVCGGQGPDERISEAEAMKNTLIAKGIDEERIIMEDKSTNTEENIKFAMESIEDKDALVVVTTNSYHVYRAVGIARKAGLSNVSGNPAGCVPGLIPQDFTREFFAVLKYKLTGNM